MQQKVEISGSVCEQQSKEHFAHAFQHVEFLSRRLRVFSTV